jgi:hypothetical protein
LRNATVIAMTRSFRGPPDQRTQEVPAHATARGTGWHHSAIVSLAVLQASIEDRPREQGKLSS